VTHAAGQNNPPGLARAGAIQATLSIWRRGGKPATLEPMNAIDPVTLVVVQNGLQQVASEMDLTFERAAFSPVIFSALSEPMFISLTGMPRSDDNYAAIERFTKPA
jgi:hypothetical protein